jgi:predicted dehydrogenase
MDCPHTDKCEFFWDMTKDERMMNLYHANEKYDGYIRDNCLWREEIDIFDKMAVQIRYANDVQVSYSLTTYSPYEGFRVAFNGMKGRMETWEGVPSLDAIQQDQSQLHAKEMDQTSHTKAELQYHEIVSQLNFRDFERELIPYVRSGHWGGDQIMFDRIFRGIDKRPDLDLSADVRDGAMSVLIGIAARKSIDEGRPIRIADLTSLDPV